MRILLATGSLSEPSATAATLPTHLTTVVASATIESGIVRILGTADAPEGLLVGER